MASQYNGNIQTGLPDYLTMMLEATTVGSSHMDSMKNTWRKEARQTCINNPRKANFDVTVTQERKPTGKGRDWGDAK